MGFDFSAVREDAEDFHLGAFSWSWMLDTGVGLILGTQNAGGGRFVYTPRPVVGEDGEPYDTCPHYNDGFPVTEPEARAISLALRGLVQCERHRREAWVALPAAERERLEKLKYGDPERRAVPVRADFVDKAEAMAAWAETSGGFAIH